ncbi:glycerol-3-phosphate 1-O-acyltransferase PlsY [Acetanaerobacterium elongatum]|uniref:Glycerol-3-phosphate acyltransferase n=1 Tax=Acetanaerobacterium elongatum TaxID=258515 RepID=A0A1G9WXT8_9FIRM|nr:glycerol-3-phosphate 1-O-acyltransferase PlsY [Acetanaerobacterium elongatum]SDM89322.1 glycerol-3-phosphate acyltransferase PlsY [Acetanaerobacterium elongatum]
MAIEILLMVATAATAYLLGSISFAVIISKALAHKDVREVGSGNAGMTNVFRSFGKLPGILTLLGDFSKGIISVIIGRLVFEYLLGLNPLYGAYVAGLFAILGHIFPLYFHFKGGKGVLTTAGMALVLDYRIFIITIGIFLLIILITRMVSVGSIIAAIAYPITTYTVYTVTGQPALVGTVITACIAALLIYMHRTNIKRILNGTESKIGSKKKNNP